MIWNPLLRRFMVLEKGGDPPAQTSTTNTTQLYSPEEAARRAKLMAEAERIYAQTAGNSVNMAGPTPSAQTLQSQQMMTELAKGGWADIAGQMPGAFNFGMQAAMDPTSAPGFKASLDTATRKVGEAYTGPTGPFAGIRSSFTGNNSGGSGTREGIAMGMAGRDYLNTIGDVTGRLTSDAYKTGLDTFTKTLAASPVMMQTMAAPSQAIGAIGQQNEAYEQAAKEWELQAPWAAMGPYASIVQGMSGPSGTSSTSTVPGPRANPMAPVGMAMMGASMGSAIMPGWGTAIGAGAGLLLSMMD